MTNDEVQAILRLLEKEYGSEKEAARAVYDGTAALLMSRHSFGVLLDGAILWAPFYSKTDANSVAKQIGGVVVKVYAPEPLKERLAAPILDNQHCEACGHPKLAHIERKWTEWKGEKWAREPGCSVPRCTCQTTAFSSQPRAA